MKHIARTFLGLARRWGLAAGAVAVVATCAFALLPAHTAQAAPGDANDPNAVWQLKGVIKYKGKTYTRETAHVRQTAGSTTVQIVTVYAVKGTPICDDTLSDYPMEFLKVNTAGTTADLITITPGTVAGGGITTCPQVTVAANITIQNPNNAKDQLFYREGDVIISYLGQNSPSFNKIAELTPATKANFNNADELFLSTAGGPCPDAIVRVGTDWLYFPMDTVAQVKNSFDLNSITISESYGKYRGPGGATTTSLCRLNSGKINAQQLEAYTTEAVALTDGVYTNECELGKTGQDLPKVINFDAAGFHSQNSYDPHSFDRKLSRFVIRCDQLKQFLPNHSQYTYVKTDNQFLAEYPDFVPDGRLGDDGYRLRLGVSTVVPASTQTPPVVTNPGTGAPGSSAPQQVCEDDSGGLAVFLCPVLRGIDFVMTWFLNDIVIPFLTIPPLTTIQGLQPAWQAVLSIANILFVIVFFIILFSQATSIGINNYGIKTLLPKLIAVAILANLSFYICVFLVDFSNVLGAGISSLISVPLGALPNTSSVTFPGGLGGGITNLLTAIGGISLAGIVVTAQGGIIAAVTALAVPLILAALVTVLILVVRLVLIVGFVVFSSIIFIGFILPGTSRTSGRLLMGFLNLLWAGPIVMAMVALDGFVIYIIHIIFERI